MSKRKRENNKDEEVETEGADRAQKTTTRHWQCDCCNRWRWDHQWKPFDWYINWRNELTAVSGAWACLQCQHMLDVTNNNFAGTFEEWKSSPWADVVAHSGTGGPNGSSIS